MDIDFVAEWIRRAFGLAFGSAGLGAAIGVLCALVLWCVLRPGKMTVLGTGLVALLFLGTGAHGAWHSDHWFAAGVVLFWGAIFVALSLRGAKTLEPAFLVSLRAAQLRAGLAPMDASSLTPIGASRGPYRTRASFDADAHDARPDDAPHASAARASAARVDLLWSRALVTLYAAAVVAVLVGVRFAS